jgi:hypothetical protein
MGGACSTNGDNRKTYVIVGKAEGERPLGNPG